ncbi:glycosyl transferase group 1 [Vulcanisaeta moutnovskia 768-28]|uniref:Glycosyl transferase group 1 n=1 Tax=Vulcanisaeta moutnovskia (strain 768-28) TaxID=985053 RepID=F0QY61_VULM7|nr:glycosyltransferase family 4 protein [Vulcanisaeta moutnovskia]ADY01298.1 glycosyl transferase group 1 [Vulcanisaeta moutnovskia 768-28]
MKIVHVHHHYWPVVGGLENVVKALAEGMAKLRHEVHVITSQYGAENRPREEVINGVHIHRVKAVRLGYPDLTYPLKVPRDLLRNADVVHGHSQNSLFTVKVVEEAKKLGIKTMMHFMAVDALRDHPNALVRLLGPKYSNTMLKRALGIADVRLARSLRDKALIEGRFGVNVEYVPDGVPRWFIERDYLGDAFRSKYGINGDYVLYVGRLHPLKGVDVLIKAMSLVINKIDLRLVIVGPGERRPYMELARRVGVDKHVFFLGFISEEDKVGAIDGSIGVVLPSISNYVEVYPMIITEAWARAKPIIATMVGGVLYRVKHMTNGLLVSPRNPAALAEAIVTLAEDKELGRRLGAEGRKSVLTWDEIVNKLLSIYSGG